jgi:hypothetical protein
VAVLLHSAYRQWMGWLTTRPPDYQYEAGFFNAAAWAPVLRPEDAPDPRAEAVLRELERSAWPLDDWGMRNEHRWGEEGLVNRLRRAYGGDSAAANKAARETCMRALRRDPGAILGLARRAYHDFLFGPLHGEQTRLRAEQGAGIRLPNDMLVELRKEFDLDAASIPTTPTPSKEYHLEGGPWYVFLVLSPLLGLLSVAVCPRGTRAAAALVALNGGLILAITCVMASVTSYRYLCPLSFTGVVALGLVADAVCRRVWSPAGPRQARPLNS